MIAKFIDGLYIENIDIPEKFSDVEEFTCIVSEKISESGEYLFHSSIQNLKKHHWFCFNRSFFCDAKIQWFCFLEGEGMVLVEELVYNAKNKTVRIDLQTTCFHELQVWIDVCYEFRKKHECDLIFGVPEFLLDRISLSRGKENFIDLNSPCENFIYAKYNIGRFDRDSSYEEFNQNPGWLVQSWWRYFRSDRNPSIHEHQHSEDLAKDILGLNYSESFNRENIDVNNFIKYSRSSVLKRD